jgi:hypothetical protein
LSATPPATWRTAFSVEHRRSNRSKDPYELTNRYASASSTLRSDLRARLNALRGCAGPECRRAENGG